MLRSRLRDEDTRVAKPGGGPRSNCRRKQMRSEKLLGSQFPVLQCARLRLRLSPARASRNCARPSCITSAGDGGPQIEAGFLTNARHQKLVSDSLATLAAAANRCRRPVFPTRCFSSIFTMRFAHWTKSPARRRPMTYSTLSSVRSASESKYRRRSDCDEPIPRRH